MRDMVMDMGRKGMEWYGGLLLGWEKTTAGEERDSGRGTPHMNER